MHDTPRQVVSPFGSVHWRFVLDARVRWRDVTMFGTIISIGENEHSDIDERHSRGIGVDERRRVGGRPGCDPCSNSLVYGEPAKANEVMLAIKQYEGILENKMLHSIVGSAHRNTGCALGGWHYNAVGGGDGGGVWPYASRYDVMMTVHTVDASTAVGEVEHVRHTRGLVCSEGGWHERVRRHERDAEGHGHAGRFMGGEVVDSNGDVASVLYVRLRREARTRVEQPTRVDAVIRTVHTRDTSSGRGFGRTARERQGAKDAEETEHQAAEEIAAPTPKIRGSSSEADNEAGYHIFKHAERSMPPLGTARR